MPAPPIPTVTNAFRASVLEAHDGDTFKARLWVLPEMYWEGRIRVARVNCPELATPDGKVAAGWTAAWLTGHPWPIVPTLTYNIRTPSPWTLVVVVIGTDNFGGRLDAEVYRTVDGRNLSDDLLLTGMAASYKALIATPMH